MDKYGVVTDEEVVCPLCGREVTRDGSVVRCPVHGSKPFEKEEDHDATTRPEDRDEEH